MRRCRSPISRSTTVDVIDGEVGGEVGPATRAGSAVSGDDVNTHLTLLGLLPSADALGVSGLIPAATLSFHSPALSRRHSLAALTGTALRRFAESRVGAVTSGGFSFARVAVAGIPLAHLSLRLFSSTRHVGIEPSGADGA